MCLISQTSFPYRAGKDIICYKILMKQLSVESLWDSNPTYNYVSPYFSYNWGSDIFGKIYAASSNDFLNFAGYDDVYDELPPVSECNSPKYRNGTTYNYCIFSGYFHTYKSFEDAKKVKSLLEETDAWGLEIPYVIVKCKIPYNTRYYEGTTDNDNGESYLSYASEYIKIDEICV